MDEDKIVAVSLGPYIAFAHASLLQPEGGFEGYVAFILAEALTPPGNTYQVWHHRVAGPYGTPEEARDAVLKSAAQVEIEGLVSEQIGM